jgi:predicted NAD-dependent protein-ADP-ribosyltransferase YbiA (DUF1768 family)
MDKIIIGDLAWLRSDYRQNIVVGGITFPTLEHAYQAAKTKDRAIKQQIADTDSVREARKIGRSCPMADDFDRQSVMERLQRLKFSDKELGLQLAKTGSAEIIMEGYNNFWGTGDDDNGQNVQGEILETIRSELQFVYGIDPDESSSGEDQNESVPLLKDAILNEPDDELADLCQQLFESAKDTITLLDANDYNIEYLMKKSGCSREVAEDAVSKVRKFQGVLTKLDDLLEMPSDRYSDDESDEEDDDSDID